MKSNTDNPDSDEYGLQGNLDLQSPQVVINLFHNATEANLQSKYRIGATAYLPGNGQLLMSGDVHDHGTNLRRLLKLAYLDRSEQQHLILHELIHGRHRVNGRDLSIRTLARIAALKLTYPDQVHLLQANHELAQLSGDEISKSGVSVVESFNLGVDFIYGVEADAVRTAMGRFIRSLLLAVKCPNKIMCTHSLPTPRRLATFDATVLDRVPTDNDLCAGGSAHLLVWGRNHTQDLADVLGQIWQVDLFVMGHQQAEMGYKTEGHSMLVIASDHDHGLALPIDLSTRYELNDLVKQLVPLASVMLS